MLKRHRASNRITAPMLALAFLSGCASKTVLVRVAPQVDMSAFRTTGIIEFASSAADSTVGPHVTR